MGRALARTRIESSAYLLGASSGKPQIGRNGHDSWYRAWADRGAPGTATRRTCGPDSVWNVAMTDSYIGADALRVEDLRLLTGEANFIDDISPAGALHAS